MASRILRRRLLHGDVDGKMREHLETSSLDDLNEPLLRTCEYNDTCSEGYTLEDLWKDERKKEQIHWSFLFSSLVAQWAHRLANIVLGSGAYFGRLLTLPSINHNGQYNKNSSLNLTPLQEERLRSLQQRLEVSFDGTRVEHQDALRQLWDLAYPGIELPHLKSEDWKDMGWQGPDPSTDFRGGGMVSLENLIFFARQYPDSFQRLLHKQEGKRAEWEYPFAVAGINISFMLTQMLNLQSGKQLTMAGIRFVKLLKEDDMAFDNLFCVAFEIMDAHWLAKRASYMQFNEVLKCTRTQLERELALEDISSVKDLPAYNLLTQIAEPHT